MNLKRVANSVITLGLIGLAIARIIFIHEANNWILIGELVLSCVIFGILILTKHVSYGLVGIISFFELILLFVDEFCRSAGGETNYLCYFQGLMAISLVMGACLAIKMEESFDENEIVSVFV